jgi:hypothetical protein
MPGPRKKPQKTDPPPENSSKKKSVSKRLQISVAMPTLSALDEKMSDQVISEVKTNIFNSINDAELQRALDKWIKDNHTESKIHHRDYHLLKSVITEYLDSYVLFGYNTEGERIIIQHAENARDRDAVMEFLKTIFIQQQQSNFLDIESDDEE